MILINWQLLHTEIRWSGVLLFRMFNSTDWTEFLFWTIIPHFRNILLKKWWFPVLTYRMGGSGSSVCITTDYGLDGPGIESRCGEILRRPHRLWGHPASCTMGTGSFPGVESGRGVTLIRHPLLVPRSKNRLELYLYSPLRAFVAYKKGETYLTYRIDNFESLSGPILLLPGRNIILWVLSNEIKKCGFWEAQTTEQKGWSVYKRIGKSGNDGAPQWSAVELLYLVPRISEKWSTLDSSCFFNRTKN